jgi:rhodanese-related sulfurtransferase
MIVNASQLNERRGRDNLALIDVRLAEDYAAGHIPGAQSFPESELDLRVATLPRDRLIVVYCQ